MSTTATPYRYLSAFANAANGLAGSVTGSFATSEQGVLSRRFRGTAVTAIVSFQGHEGTGVDWSGARWALRSGGVPILGPFYLHRGVHAFPMHLNVDGNTMVNNALLFQLTPSGATWALGQDDAGLIDRNVGGSCTLLILPSATF